MTTIVGLQGPKWSVIGADSMITAFADDGFITAQSLLPSHASKIAERDGYVIGAAGDVRAINILHHVYDPPSLRYATTPEKVDQHITRRVVPTLRQCFDVEGFSPPDSDKRDHKAEQNSTIILSIKTRVYVIENDYSWTQDAEGIYTIGTGAQYARGALHLLLPDGVKKLSIAKATEIVNKALDVAKCYDPYTGGTNKLLIQTES